MKIEEKPLEPTVEDVPITRQILVIRDKQVMLDRDLATLYGVETKRIKEQVKRNIERFPKDFCFQLTQKEFEAWRSQFATSKADRKGLRYNPYAFTEQGIAMLSSVLKSETAIKVNIAIMRAFVAARQILMQNGGLVNRLSNVESKMLEQDARLQEHDHKFDTIFEAMDRGELQSKGLYYNNQMFDAYVFVCGLIRQAKRRIVLVDRFLFIDDTAYHFGASLKDLGTNTFFFTKEDFTLEEVLKKSEEMRLERELDVQRSDIK